MNNASSSHGSSPPLLPSSSHSHSSSIAPHQQQHSSDLGSLSNSMLENHRGSSASPCALSDGGASGGSYGCLQCSASFSNRDLLEKHELMHSPSSNMVSLFHYIYNLKSKISKQNLN